MGVTKDKEPRFTFQFFRGDECIFTVWVDTLEYDRPHNTYVGKWGSHKRYFIQRESITHFRRLTGRK